MNTPWGKSDTRTTLMRGFHHVTTSGHGGLAISKALATKELSEKAIKFGGIVQGGYIFFEEDCAFALPLYESDILHGHYSADNTRSIPLTKEYLKTIIEQWFPKYFERVES